MEYLDLYDENKKLTGEKFLRGSGKPEKGKYVNIVIVFIENNEGKFLIQKTSKERNSIWATTGGHVKLGSNCNEAIIEEIKEELGIDINIKDIKHVQTNKFEMYFQDVYYLKKNINIEDLALQKTEVECVKWLSVDEIKELIDKDEFRKGNIKAFNYIVDNKNNIQNHILCQKN